ncbi:EpsG family protein [Duncaniella freteri]|uniref:EpsG family protein n=4 Tax=Duncaniella TaxID=2518495 RepID=UPI0013718808|nr:EpsG family protein [Duncaniella freteri]NBJ07491.1 EpsG family protein [Alistipes sp. Z76]NCE69504.1 EpsG family protein [Muribaculaceae bacterium M3]
MVLDFSNRKIRNKILYSVCILMGVMTGFRNHNDWRDTYGYVASFEKIKTLDLFDVNQDNLLYQEKGFYLLTSSIKTLCNNSTFYLLCIGLLSSFLLAKNLSRYCLFPFLGLGIYIARFYMTRDLMQIRAGLAIMIVCYAIQYIKRKKLWKYLLIVLLASSMHISVLLAIPFYWINKININCRKILLWLFVAFVSAFICEAFINLLLNEHLEIIKQAYIDGNSEYSKGHGLSNPMIYFQCLILLVFTFSEKNLKDIIPYYFIFRNGYFYSTILLILLSPYLVLSGRTSTIFATFEIFIIPSFIIILSGKLRIAMYLVIGCVMIGIFFLNCLSLIDSSATLRNLM